MKSNLIRVRLNILFAIVALILFLAVGLVFYRSTKIAVVYSKEKELETLSQETSNKIERFLFERYGDIQVLSESPVLTRNNIETKLKTEYLDSVMKAYKTYDYIVATDSFGKIKAYSGKGIGDINYDEWVGRIAGTNTYVSDFTYLPRENAYVIYLAAPLKDSSGNITGAVFERVNCEAIKDIVNNVKLGTTGYAFFASSKDEYMVPNQNKNKSAENIGANSNSGITYYDLEGKKFISAYYKLSKYDSQNVNWYLFVEQSQIEAFEISNNLGKFTLIVVLISVLAIFVLIIYMSRVISTPFNLMNTSLKSMEQKVIKITGELEKSVIRAKHLESLAAMSSGIAHEIKNPLTSIKGYAQLIKIELSDSNMASDVDIIIDEVERLNRIVDRFLSFARPKELKLKPAKVNDVIIETVKTLELELKKSNIKLSFYIKETPYVMLDFDEMEQVIMNLVLNSIQSIEKDGEIKITTGYEKLLDMVFIIIKDNGMGIKNEDTDKIFEPFYTTKDKGTGLGLAICSRIIENHKGFIELNSEYGSGTEFIIKLPATKDW